MYRKYFDENSNEVSLSNEIRDRDNPCEVCQVTKLLIINNINIDKKIELLPFVTSNIVGEYNDINNTINNQKNSFKVGAQYKINEYSSFKYNLEYLRFNDSIDKSNNYSEIKGKISLKISF